MRNILTILFLTLGVFTSGAFAQQAAKNVPVSGEVAAIDSAKNLLMMKTASGEVGVTFNAATEFKRIAPDKLSVPASAVPATLAEFSIGDKVTAVGILSDDKKTINPTRRIFLVTKDDLAKQSNAEREKWTTRGVSGKVTSVNLTTNEITLSIRGGFGGDKTTIVAANDKTKFQRYAPNSVKYSDAKNSNFAEIKVGDQLRAYGEKSPDNARLTAEGVLSGSFRMVAGKITAIDAAKNEITVKDLNTDKAVVISVNADTLLRRFPAEMASNIARIQAMRAMGGGQMPAGMGGGQGAGTRPAGQMPPQGTMAQGNGQGAGQGNGQGAGMMRGGGGGDVDSMIDKMPLLTIAELKVGDAVAASSSGGATPDRVTAIKFVAGIEPFLTVPQAPAASGGRPQSSPQISIPGLDGGGF